MNTAFISERAIERNAGNLFLVGLEFLLIHFFYTKIL